MLGGMSFYQRKEVKDLLSYLRFIVNHNDEEALRRIINEPKRGIGPTNVDKIFKLAEDHAISLWEVISNIKSFVNGRVAEAIEEFATMIWSIASELTNKDAYEIASETAKTSGLLKSLYEDKTIEGLARYENIQELLNGIKTFTANPEQSDNSLPNFLQNIALSSTTDIIDEEEDKISLMTIHAAKGLEFKYVYIVGIEEDLFPSPMMLGSKEDLEEERRLFYVAITRAKRKIFLSYTISRYRFGKLKQCEVSRFISEIDPTYLQITTTKNKNTETANTSYTKQFINSMKPKMQNHPIIGKQNIHTFYNKQDFENDDINQLQVGMQIEHPIFGIGKVTFLELAGTLKKAKIIFNGLGEKTLLLSFAKLKILKDFTE